MTLGFTLHATDGRARRGTVHLDRGTIETPVFMPVGTAATVKAMMPRDLKALGTQISLANTYHLHIQPGEALVEKAGGLHRFMATPWPLLTDSGGFQVFSLPGKELSEEGVRFAFRKGAEPIFASPEWSMRVQRALGADIVMAFDECAPWPCSEDYAEAAMERTLRWLDRSVTALDDSPGQHLFGIVQGSVYERLRRRSAEETVKRDLPGYAIGGVSVGEGHPLMMRAVDGAEPWLPTDRPRYLMGVGLPEDIVGAVGRGMDMFDCVIPTRYGRSATCFTRHGRIRLTDRRYRNDHFPIDPSCTCYACENFTRAYVHHLMVSDEILGTMLCTLHNIAFYHRLMAEIREAIASGTYDAFCARFHEEYVVSDRKRRREPIEALFEDFSPGAACRQWPDAATVAQNLPSTRDDARLSGEAGATEDRAPRRKGQKREERLAEGAKKSREAAKHGTRGSQDARRGGRPAANSGHRTRKGR